mgnify:CR=1 FL=1
MLRNTFRHIAGIGQEEERVLWRHGVLRWDQVPHLRFELFSPELTTRLRAGAAESIHRLRLGDALYFMQRLPPELWPRLYPEFSDRFCYLDIETTGLDPDADHITVVTLVHGDRAKTYVWGRTLHRFPLEVPEDALFVTFNGERLDLPMLAARFGHAVVRPQIDLQRVLKAYGHRGGLKQIEPTFRIRRHPGVALDGVEAVELWKRYVDEYNGNALDALIAYNRRDASTLQAIIKQLYRQSMQGFPRPFCSLKTE